MSAALLQGVPGSTLDTDLWLDLPERQHAQALHIALKLGGTILARTVVGLRDDTLINFLYRVDGLQSFDAELRKAHEVRLYGVKVKVLPLARIIASKEFIGRAKDIAHLPILKETLKARRRLKTKPSK